MQKAVAKYGLAAHLALLAVAPLFLFPFFGNHVLAVVLLWLCLYSAVWLVLSPSMLGGELLEDSRRRILSAMVRDPLFWIFAAVVIVVGFRALNAGVRVSFDYETAEWMILPPSCPFLLGSVDGAGLLPFAAALSASIVILGCRNALGKSARMMFMLMISVFSGIASLVVLYLLGSDDAAVAAAAGDAAERLTNPGLGFAIGFLCSATALFAVTERDWWKSTPLLVVANGGTAAASFVFLAFRDFVVFAFVYILLVAGSVMCVRKLFNGAKGAKAFLVFLISLGFACVLVDASAPDNLVETKMAECICVANESESGEGEKPSLDVREVLSDVASKVWAEHLWTGVGVGAFQFCPRFHLSQDEMAQLPVHMLVVPNSWRHILAERGIIGALLFALPLIVMFASYLGGAFRCIRVRAMPDSAGVLAPLALAAVIFASFYGVSILRAEVLSMMGAILVISAKSFPKGDSNG